MKTFEELYNQEGSYKTDENYKEILKLNEMLNEKGIPHTLENFLDGWQVIYPKNGKEKVMDAVEHFGSYGNKEDRLEIMGLLTEEELENDDVLGFLTAKEVFERIEKHWAENFGNVLSFDCEVVGNIHDKEEVE